MQVHKDMHMHHRTDVHMKCDCWVHLYGSSRNSKCSKCSPSRPPLNTPMWICFGLQQVKWHHSHYHQLNDQHHANCLHRRFTLTLGSPKLKIIIAEYKLKEASMPLKLAECLRVLGPDALKQTRVVPIWRQPRVIPWPTSPAQTELRTLQLWWAAAHCHVT